jgi:hypothetical protein
MAADCNDLGVRLFYAARERWGCESFRRGPARSSAYARGAGEVSEWLKEHAWKVCIG